MLYNERKDALVANDNERVAGIDRKFELLKMDWTNADHDWFEKFALDGGTVTIEE